MSSGFKYIYINLTWRLTQNIRSEKNSHYNKLYSLALQLIQDDGFKVSTSTSELYSGQDHTNGAFLKFI